MVHLLRELSCPLLRCPSNPGQLKMTSKYHVITKAFPPVLAFFLTVLPTFAADFSGPVVSVLDGDTIEVLHNTRAERIRSNASTVQRRARPMVTRPSKRHLP
jgi:endonuclease YncB( thermonuclease family)